MDIDIRNIIFQIINTLILFFVLRKIFFKPVTKFLDERQNTIKNKIDRTEEDLKEAAKLKEEYEQKLREARQEALSIMDSASSQGEKKREEIISQARTEAERIKEKASAEIESEKEQALTYLRDHLAELATSAASVVLEKSLDTESQAHLVDSFLEGLDESDEK
ncbi:MAG: F0F1 ATP synthase subunit B [Clostridia bacterium]